MTTVTELPLTVAEMRRRVVPGAVFDVTNHIHTNPESAFFGTKRRTVVSASTVGFYLSLEGDYAEQYPEGSRVEWPKAQHLAQTDDGTILMFGGQSTRPDDWLIQPSHSATKYHIAPEDWEPGPWSPDGIGTTSLCGELDPTTRYVGNVVRRGSWAERTVCVKCSQLSGDPRGGPFLTLTPVEP